MKTSTTLRSTLAAALVLLPALVCAIVLHMHARSIHPEAAASAMIQPETVSPDNDSIELPLRFEANHGQVADAVDYIARSGAQTMFLMPNGFALSSLTADEIVSIALVAADAGARVEPGNELPGRTNYFNGGDASQWVRGVPGYESVTYRDVYRDIDVIYYGNKGSIEYDFIVAPGADPAAIALASPDASDVVVEEDGRLTFNRDEASFSFHEPYAYQNVEGVHTEVEVAYAVDDHDNVTFALGEYNPDATLIIDPLIQYATFFGGNGEDIGYDIAVDASGNAYITGMTSSNNLHVSGNAFDPTGNVGGFFDPGDAFVAKIDSSGSALIYGTYLSGRFKEVGFSIAVDQDGCAYVVGATDSDDDPNTAGVNEGFPLRNPIQGAYGGDTDLFITKLSADGSDLVYSTYFGGDMMDRGNSEQEQPAIDVDLAGCAYVAGTTQSTLTATPGALSNQFPGPFALKLNAAGSAMEYLTHLGSNDFVFVWDMEVDAFGQATICGFTGMNDIEVTPGSVQPAKANAEDGFIQRVNADGSALVYGTYFGGNSDDFFYAIDLDPLGNAYVTGMTTSNDYPGAPGSSGGVLTKINNAGDTTVYSTIIGADVGLAVAVDRLERATVVGEGPDGSSRDVVFTQFTASGGIYFETWWGGFFIDQGFGIALDPAGTAFVTGMTASSSFPNDTVLNPNPLQPSMATIPDAYVVKVPRDVPTGIRDNHVPTRATTLEQNYPNPFNPTTTIRWTQGSAGSVSLRVYDVRGRLVKTLLQEFRAAGTQQALWDASNDRGTRVASGTYYYELRTGSTVETRKMVLLK